MNGKGQGEADRKWDFNSTYTALPQDGKFMKRTLAQVEKDPLLGERDRWKLAADLRQMDWGVSYPNGEAPKEHVQRVHAAIAEKRQGSEQEALSKDPFIKQSIFDNPELPEATKTALARKANQARQSQEYAVRGPGIDNEILRNI